MNLTPTLKDADRSEVGDPGIDDQEIDGTVRRPGFIERFRDTRAVSDVALDRGSAVAFGDRSQRLHPSPK